VCGVVQLHPGRTTHQEQLRVWLLAGVGAAVPVRLLPEAGVIATVQLLSSISFPWWHAARLLALLFDWRGVGGREKKIVGAGASFLRWWEEQEHKEGRERARACWIAHVEKGAAACLFGAEKQKKSE